MFLTYFGVSQSRTSFTFSSSIFISSGPITTPKNSTSLTFHLHFSGFTYKLFSASLLTTFSTNLLCPSYISVLMITLFIKLATLLVLMKSYRILFIIVWNIVSELVSPKNIIISLNDSSSIVNAVFHSCIGFTLGWGWGIYQWKSKYSKYYYMYKKDWQISKKKI